MSLDSSPEKKSSAAEETPSATNHDLAEAFKISEEKLHHALMQVPALIAILSGPPYIYEFANPSYKQLVGNREVTGKPVTEALPKLDGPGFIEILDEVYATGKPVIVKEVIAKVETEEEQNNEKYFNFEYQPVFDAQKKYTKYRYLGWR